MASVKVCPALIPAVELRVLCNTILDSAQKFFENPENQRQFEEWKRQKEEQAKCPHLKSK